MTRAMTAPLLMTPGPTRVPERVLRAGAQPMLHHRSRAFLAEFAEMLRLIRPVFGTREVVMPVHTTGRGSMEATICNLCSPGDEIIVCANGRFGELWAKIGATYGLVVHRVATDWSRDIDPADVDAALERHPDARLVAMTCTDTSTGVANDIQAIVRVARPRGALVVVDGVSAIGGLPFHFDEWDVDAALTASQKCLMSAPGLAFVVMSARARASAAAAKLPKSYWDFREIHEHAAKALPDTVGTPPVHVMLQVVEALRAMHEEGLDAVYERHVAMGQRARARAAAAGLSLSAPGFRQFAPTITALAAPGGLPPQDLRDALEARGILVAEGLGQFASTGFRIGHMGDIRVEDVDRTFDLLAEVLAERAPAAGHAAALRKS
jgi:aspartate aminotransferase-like enzyme